MKRQQCGGRDSHRRFWFIGAILVCLVLGSVTVRADNGWEDWTGGAGVINTWFTPGNWNNPTGDPAVPVSGDWVRFGSKTIDSDSVMDISPPTIAGLRYQGGGNHTLHIPAGTTLQIDGHPVQVGQSGTNNGAAVTWDGGGTVVVGTSAAPQALNVGLNTADDQSNTAMLTLNNVTVTSNSDSGSAGLALGVNTGSGSGYGGLILGPGSQFNAGWPTDAVSPGLTIGYNAGLKAGGSGMGLMDASGGTAEIHVEELFVGNNKNGDTDGLGSASGTLTTGANTTLTSSTAYIARGNNTTGVVNMNGGLFSANVVELGSGGTFNFTGGRLAVNDFRTFGGVGTLEQKGGTLAPGFDVANRAQTSLAGTSVIRGDYALDSAGILEIELFADGADQLNVLGGVNLDADSQGGGTLDLKLNFAPLIDDQFTVIDNDGADEVLGQFAGLANLATLDRTYLGSTYRFEINYAAGTGNDVVLKVISHTGDVCPVIPAPGAMVLGGIGVGLVEWLRKRRTL